MKRILVCMIALLVITSPVLAANLLTNGNFEGGGSLGGSYNSTTKTYSYVVNGWSNYAYSSWSTKDMLGESGPTTAAVSAPDTGSYDSATYGAWSMQPYSGSSFCLSSSNPTGGGIYQVIDVTPGTQYSINGMWTNWAYGSDSGPWWWFQVNMFSWDGTTSLTAGGGPLDSGTGTIFKRASGLNTKTGIMSWRSFTDVMPGDTNGNVVNSNIVTASTTKMVVALLYGNSHGSSKRTRAMFDNVAVEAVPEPGSMIAMLAGAIGLAGVIRRRR